MHLNYLRNTFAGIMFSLILSHPVSGEQRIYPSADQTPLVVGTEQYDENYTSLAGLEGVHVISKYVQDSAKKNEFKDMPNDLVLQIEKRLNSAGLRMLSEKDLEKTPGQPTLSFFPAYSGNKIDEITAKQTPNTELPEKNSDSAAHDCCRSSIWASFQQSSSILRAPNKQYKFATWGLGDDTDDCENQGAWTYDAVLKIVDKFVADYTKAQSEIEKEMKPKLVSNASEAPEDCGQTWLMNLNVFETNQTSISDAVKPILDKLALTAARCERYRYIIETHADQRADTHYNKVLSEARAFAIKDYLVGMKIAYDRLETMAFGESKPLTSGTSETDHAVNRRVVITPHLNES